MKKRILVTGSIAYDVLLGYEGSFPDAIDPEAIGRLSVSFFSPHFARHHGGTGANIAWNLKLLGSDPLLVATVGSDGGEYISLLENRGIETRHVEQRNDSVTATAIVGTDSDERQISFFHPGADSYGEWPGISSDGIVYGIVSARDTTAMVRAMEWCSENSIPVFFDPGQQAIAFGDDAFERMVHMSCGIIVNEYEWDVTQKKLGCDEEGVLDIIGSGQSKRRSKDSVGGILIVTCGDQGCLVSTRDGSELIPACKTDKVINPTGAGDGFRAGLLAGLAEGRDTISACRLGCAMGRAAVEQEGTLLEGVSRTDVELMIKN